MCIKKIWYIIVLLKYWNTEITEIILPQLLTHILLYKAFQSFAEFEGYAPGIAREVEALAANPCGLEVRMQAAVRPARHGDELAAEDVRVAFAGLLGQRLGERVVLASVACEHARVILSQFSPAVASQDSFQVDAKLGCDVWNYWCPVNFWLIYQIA